MTTPIPIPLGIFTDHKNQKTSGIVGNEILVFEPNAYLNDTNQKKFFTSIVSSILVTNVTDFDITVSCYITDYSTTPGSNHLYKVYIAKQKTILSNDTIDLLKNLNSLTLLPTDQIILTCDSNAFTCDCIISYQNLIQ